MSTMLALKPLVEPGGQYEEPSGCRAVVEKQQA
jgi:hypothetical protein